MRNNRELQGTKEVSKEKEHKEKIKLVTRKNNDAWGLAKTNFYQYSRINLDIVAPRESRCSYNLGWKRSPCMYNMGNINKIKWIKLTSDI
jgi:hypothetical protein